jgi:heavy metal sensor kinase
MKWLHSIKTRITLWYFIATAVIVVFFSVTSYYILLDSLKHKNYIPWDIQVARTEETPNGNIKVTGFETLTQIMGQGYDGAIAARKGFDSSQLSKLMQETGIVQVGTFEEKPIIIDTNLLPDQDLSPQYEIWIYTIISKSDRDKHELLVVFQQTDNVYTMGIFRRALLISVSLTLAISAVIGYFLVTRMLRPIKTITLTAKEMGDKNLKQRLKNDGNDELGELSSTLNQMFERLEKAFNYERQFTAEVSHHLRTPLAIAQGEATLALREERGSEEYRRTIEVISREISRLSSIINRLLFLAYSENGRNLLLSEVNIKNLLTELVSDVQVISDEKKINIQLEGPENLVLRGDKMRLRELFLNLLDNAIYYTPPVRKITVSLSKQGNYALVSVRDTGIGIAEDSIPNLFKRFYRIDKSRSQNEGGSGLGLAICKRIVDLHYGKIEVESEVGKGSTFSVYLPLLNKQ